MLWLKLEDGSSLQTPAIEFQEPDFFQNIQFNLFAQLGWMQSSIILTAEFRSKPDITGIGLNLAYILSGLVIYVWFVPI